MAMAMAVEMAERRSQSTMSVSGGAFVKYTPRWPYAFYAPWSHRSQPVPQWPMPMPEPFVSLPTNVGFVRPKFPREIQKGIAIYDLARIPNELNGQLGDIVENENGNGNGNGSPWPDTAQRATAGGCIGQ